jgi:hypothetical protein
VSYGTQKGSKEPDDARNVAVLLKLNSAWPLRNALSESGKTVLDPVPFFLYPSTCMKTKTKKQVAYLLSKVSPLSGKEQGKLKKELHSGDVKIKPKK